MSTWFKYVLFDIILVDPIWNIKPTLSAHFYAFAMQTGLLKFIF